MGYFAVDVQTKWPKKLKTYKNSNGFVFRIFISLNETIYKVNKVMTIVLLICKIMWVYLNWYIEFYTSTFSLTLPFALGRDSREDSRWISILKKTNSNVILPKYLYKPFF